MKIIKRKPGAFLESKVIEEAASLGHSILIAHPENPNRSGVDVVSYDAKDRSLHLWEAKDWHSRAVRESDLTSFLNLWGLPSRRQLSRWKHEAHKKARERGKRLWKEIINQVSSEKDQTDICEAINNGRVLFHLRGYLDTRYSQRVITEFTSKLPWAKFDIANLKK